MIIVAETLGKEEWEKVTERKLPVINKLLKATNESTLIEGDIMENKLPSVTEISERIRNAKGLSITFKPTEKTLVHMLMPRPSFTASTSTGKKIRFVGSDSYTIQLTEVKNNLDARLINSDSYLDAEEAAESFARQIDFCVKMYGRVQTPVMQWN